MKKEKEKGKLTITQGEKSKISEELKSEVEGAIDKSVFDEALSAGEYLSDKASRTIDADMLSKEQIKRTRTVTRLLHTSDSFVNISSAERYYPTLEDGLSSEQVNKRIQDGLFNYSTKKGGKSYLSIFIGNIFTYFNMLTFAVAIALMIFGASITKFFFLVIVLLNTAIGIFQEIRSKLTVEKLKLVTAPTVTVIRDGNKATIPTEELVLDDIMFVELGKQVCADAVVVKGEAELNESLLTGESVPVKKKAGDMLFSGSFVSGGSCYARVDKVGSANYVEKLASYAKRYKKPKSELRNSVGTIIRMVSVIIIPVAAILLYLGAAMGGEMSWTDWQNNVYNVSGAVIGMIPSGMFLLTSIALFTSVIRLARKRTLVQDLYCIEMLARVDVLCLDKTGTITDGTMQVNSVKDLSGEGDEKISKIIGSLLSATGDNNQTAQALVEYFGYSHELEPKTVVPFSSQRKLSAVTFDGIGTYLLGAPEFIMRDMSASLKKAVDENARKGLRVMLLAHSPKEISSDRLPSSAKPIALIAIEDHIRPDAAETIRWFKENDVAIKIISGDNPVTVAEVSSRVGVEHADRYISLEGLSTREVIEAASKYTVFGRVSPEQKCTLIKALKNQGSTVAMTGDGVNDILAMREADCSVAMASGSDAAKNVAHLVLLDSSFSSMPEVVLEGRRVVNNIQQSSSLFLMKTLMSVLLSIISIILLVAKASDTLYFFDTSNLTGLEVFVIGIPSFALALQPNKSIIRGKFLSNVLKQCIPGGIALVCGVMSVYFYNLLGAQIGVTLSPTEYKTMLIAVVMFTGCMSLVRICQPYNAYRVVLVITTFCLVLFALTGLYDLFAVLSLPQLFGDVTSVMSIGFNNLTFIATIIFASYFIIAIIDALLNKIKLRRRG